MNTKDIMLDGQTYTLHYLNTSDALKVLTFMTQVLGKPLSKLAGNLLKGESNNLENILDSEANIEDAVSSLIEGLNDPDIHIIIEKICTSVSINGQKLIFEVHFQGKILHLCKLVIEALKYNFNDFFCELFAKRDTSQAPLTTTQAPQAQTGEFGESLMQGMAH